METKICSKCKIEKDLSEFGKNPDRRIGITSSCKACIKKRNRDYRSRNRKQISVRHQDYLRRRKENGGKPLNNIVRMSDEERKKKQSDYSTKYNRERSAKDPLYKLRINLRRNISGLFARRDIRKKSKTEDILGISFEEFKIYIESLFTEGMSWDNYGEWHIDHKIPASWAQTEEELLKLNNYTNLQPLWASENLSKKDRYESK